eukprot:8090731-Pyramimonas_sp.AAC.1
MSRVFAQPPVPRSGATRYRIAGHSVLLGDRRRDARSRRPCRVWSGARQSIGEGSPPEACRPPLPRA